MKFHDWKELARDKTGPTEAIRPIGVTSLQVKQRKTWFSTFLRALIKNTSAKGRGSASHAYVTLGAWHISADAAENSGKIKIAINGNGQSFQHLVSFSDDPADTALAIRYALGEMPLSAHTKQEGFGEGPSPGRLMALIDSLREMDEADQTGESKAELYAGRVLRNVKYVAVTRTDGGSWFRGQDGETKELARLIIRGLKPRTRGVSFRVKEQGGRVYIFVGKRGAVPPEITAR